MSHDHYSANIENLPAAQDDMRRAMEGVQEIFDEPFVDAADLGYDSVRYSIGGPKLDSDPLGFKYDRIDIEYAYGDDPADSRFVSPMAKFTFVEKPFQGESVTTVVSLVENGQRTEVSGQSIMSYDVAHYGDVRPDPRLQESDIAASKQQVAAAFLKAIEDGTALEEEHEDLINGGGSLEVDTRVRESDIANIEQVLRYLQIHDPKLVERQFPED